MRRLSALWLPLVVGLLAGPMGSGRIVGAARAQAAGNAETAPDDQSSRLPAQLKVGKATVEPRVHHKRLGDPARIGLPAVGPSLPASFETNPERLTVARGRVDLPAAPLAYFPTGPPAPKST